MLLKPILFLAPGAFLPSLLTRMSAREIAFLLDIVASIYKKESCFKPHKLSRSPLSLDGFIKTLIKAGRVYVVTVGAPDLGPRFPHSSREEVPKLRTSS